MENKSKYRLSEYLFIKIKNKTPKETLRPQNKRSRRERKNERDTLKKTHIQLVNYH